jgi:hypothetical protein
MLFRPTQANQNCLAANQAQRFVLTGMMAMDRRNVGMGGRMCGLLALTSATHNVLRAEIPLSDYNVKSCRKLRFLCVSWFEGM